jgi:ubiquinone/menaquinone biosynthesis C-methylase UbiE
MRKILPTSESGRLDEDSPFLFGATSPSTQMEEVPWYFREDITSTYETWYEGKYKRADVQEKAILRKGIDWIGDVRTVFEVGCGTAHFTRYFDEIGIDTYGADLSPYMLKEAMRLSRGGKLTRATSASLPVREKVVDAVAFITCFEYMPAPVEVIREASRVARKGILFGLMNSWSIPTVRRKIQIIFGKNPFYKNAHFYSLPEIKRTICQAIGKESCEIFQRSSVFPRVLPVSESRLPFGAFLCVCVRFNQ